MIQFDLLACFDALHLGFTLVLLAFLFGVARPDDYQTQRWRWGALPIAAVCLVYSPVYAIERRYYYPALPFLFAASIALTARLPLDARKGGRRLRWIALTVVVCSFLLPPAVEVGQSCTTGSTPRRRGWCSPTS